MIHEFKHVDLNRTFQDYHLDNGDKGEKRTASQELWYLEIMESLDQDSRIRWKDLHANMRLVVLGDAGAGKTAELEQQAKALTLAGETSFYMTVDKLARAGLEKATNRFGENGLSRWRKRGGTAHFFIDSVDQARLNGQTLDSALDELQEELTADELAQARIVFSCRYTDWRFIQDCQSVSRFLSTPNTVNSEDRYNTRVVVLLPLDRNQMRIFAEAHELEQKDDFLRELQETGTEILARRPGDLLSLMRYWDDKKQIGSLTELLSHTTHRFLREENSSARKSSLNIATTLRAVHLLAGALTITRSEEIANPTDDTQQPSNAWLHPSRYLHDLTESEIMEILGLRFFDPATFGRVKFHHRSYQEFLVAQWLDSAHEAGLSSDSLNNFLFGTIRGQLTVRPQLSATAAWLAQKHESVRDTLQRTAPQVLITEGDPAELSATARTQALRAYIALRSDREFLHDSIDAIALRKFARPDLGEAVADLLRCDLPDDRIKLLLRIVRYGKIQSCNGLVLHYATTSTQRLAVRTQAIAAIGAVGLPADKIFIIEHYQKSATLTPEILRAIVVEFYPDHLPPEDLLVLLAKPRTDEPVTSGDSGGYDQHRISRIVCERTPAARLPTLITQLQDMVTQISERGIDKHAEFVYELYGRAVVAHAKEWKAGEDVSSLVSAIGESAGRLGRRFGRHGWPDSLETTLKSNVELRRVLFERMATDGDDAPIPGSLQHVWTPEPSDSPWLLEIAASSSAPTHLRRASMLILLQRRGILAVDTTTISHCISDEPSLSKQCSEILARHRVTAAQHAHWKRKQRTLENQEQQAQNDHIVDSRNHIESIRSGADLPRLLGLYFKAIQDHPMPLQSLSGLRGRFDDEIVAATEEGVRKAWRLHDLHQRPPHSLETALGFTSADLDLQSKSDVQSLDEKLARRAVELGIRHPRGFPGWFQWLPHVYPEIVCVAIENILRDDTKRDELLNRMSRGPGSVCALCLDTLWALLEEASNATSVTTREAVGSLLGILARDGHAPDRIAATCRLACERTTEPKRYAVWWPRWFRHEPAQATTHLQSVDSAGKHVRAAAARLASTWPTPLPSEAATLGSLWSMITKWLPEVSRRFRPGSTKDKAASTRTWIINELAKSGFPGGYDVLLELAEGHPRYRDWLLIRAEQRLQEEAMEASNPVADYILGKYRAHGTRALERLADPPSMAIATTLPRSLAGQPVPTNDQIDGTHEGPLNSSPPEPRKAVDVLIITALRDELEALFEVTAGLLEPWSDGKAGDLPYRVALYQGQRGPFRVAAARLTRMGGIATATVATRLADLLSPGCLAMCGVCAGHPEGTDLGDVVIADRVFLHDYGKVKSSAFEGDLWVHLLSDTWLRAAQELEGPAEGFHGYVAADDEAGQWWFIEQLLDGRDPLRSAALRRHVPDARRAVILEALRGKLGYVSFANGAFSLTDAGRHAGQEHRTFHGTLVTQRPYHIHVGPMGSGNSVVADGVIWDRLAANQGMRKTLAVEMEAASVGQVAHERSLPFVVVKGVMDHADKSKTDRFKVFAARVSAEVLLAFLRRTVTSVAAYSEHGPGGATGHPAGEPIASAPEER